MSKLRTQSRKRLPSAFIPFEAWQAEERDARRRMREHLALLRRQQALLAGERLKPVDPERNPNLSILF